MTREPVSNNPLDGIIWMSQFCHTKTTHSSSCNIKVTLTKDKKGNRRVYIYMYRDVDKMFGEYMDVAVYKNRLYLRKSEDVFTGFHISRSETNRHYPMVQIAINDTTECLTAFVGEYVLKHDELYDLEYIERTS